MRKSKLELYEEALSALVERNLSVADLADKCNMNLATAKRISSFLERNRLIEKNHNATEAPYSLTPRGKAVHRRLSCTKRLNKLKESIRTKVMYATNHC